MNINKIVIVGGGTAGFMSAAHMIKNFPNMDITVIESPDFPTVGVGESTLQHIRVWMNAMCISEEEWMPHCDGAYKASIKFTNWNGDGKSYHYPFGPCEFLYGDNDPSLLAMFDKEGGIDHSEFAELFFPAALMAEKKKMVARMGLWDYKKQSAFHFDATMFGQWLKENYFKARGGKVINDTVTEVKTDGTTVTSLSLESGETITADVFIDCTGWKSLLLSAVGETFIDYGHILPNNKAWATRIPEVSDAIATECTALSNGWVWNIPTKTRIGTGYVYSDKYVSDDDALKEFKEYLGRDDLEFKNISMRIGRHDKLASGNVAAVGLSYGFIEPLESNGLFTVHENLYLVEKLIRSGFTSGAKQAANKASAKNFDNFAEFVYQHYAFAQRTDTPYWRDAGEKNSGLCSKMDEIMTDSIMNEFVDMNQSNGLFCVAVGSGFNPCSQREAVLHAMFTDRNIIEEAYNVTQELYKRKEEWSASIDDMEEVPRTL